MRAIIQRVVSGAVTVDGAIISSIQKGFVVLVGYCPGDGPDDLDYISRKILNVKLFPDSNGRQWKADVKAVNGEIILVSQFTLYHRLKGNNPDFSCAMKTEDAREMHQRLIEIVKKNYVADRVKDGQFGAMMQVSIENDGPVTISIDSNQRVNSVSSSNPSTPSQQEDDGGEGNGGKAKKGGKGNQKFSSSAAAAAEGENQSVSA